MWYTNQEPPVWKAHMPTIVSAGQLPVLPNDKNLAPLLELIRQKDATAQEYECVLESIGQTLPVTVLKDATFQQNNTAFVALWPHCAVDEKDINNLLNEAIARKMDESVVVQLHGANVCAYTDRALLKWALVNNKWEWVDTLCDRGTDTSAAMEALVVLNATEQIERMLPRVADVTQPVSLLGVAFLVAKDINDLTALNMLIDAFEPDELSARMEQFFCLNPHAPDELRELQNYVLQRRLASLVEQGNVSVKKKL